MMGDALLIAAYAGLAWSIIVACVSLEALRRFVMRAAPACATSAAPALTECASALSSTTVLLVRPCAGAEPLLERTLLSLRDARRSFPVCCRFAVAEESDAAFPVARRACELLKLDGVNAQIVVTGAAGPNKKASQLAAAIDREDARACVVIVADSDVDLSGADLDQLVGPLVRSPRAELLWAPPVERAHETGADRASAAVLGGSLHAFPLLALLDARGAVGKLFSVRLDTLASVGGFGSLTNVLGEDVELARRVRDKGGRIQASAEAALSLARGRSWEQVVSRYVRWLVMIRAQRPLLLLSYPGLFFATPLIAALSCLVAQAAPSIAIASVVTVSLARFLVALGASRASGRSAGVASLIADCLLADTVLLLAFLRALSTRRIVWRSAVLIVDRSGVLRETAA